ncbi:RidA family protein [Pacificibacter sp. AS14]|uniref:RidA family protein n=1 Tax=Pacificibacter sp. AS14 TaxID=3135785 RepID=UPI0031715153
MIVKALIPSSISAPFGRYAHGVEIPPNWRTVRSSGQLGLALDGTIPTTVLEQARVCFANISAILAEANMGPADVAHISGFVTDRAYFAEYMVARDAFMQGIDRPPASTLLIVSGFTKPEFLVEVEVMACAP